MSLLIGGMLLSVEIGARIMKYAIDFVLFVVIGFVLASVVEYYTFADCAKGQTFTYADSVYECVVKTYIGDE